LRPSDLSRRALVQDVVIVAGVAAVWGGATAVALRTRPGRPRDRHVVLRWPANASDRASGRSTATPPTAVIVSPARRPAAAAAVSMPITAPPA